MNNALKIREDTKARLEVAEGIYGTWYYHLRQPLAYVGLCGDSVMHTSIPISAWGTRTHINERWCSRCAKEARKLETSTDALRQMREAARAQGR